MTFVRKSLCFTLAMTIVVSFCFAFESWKCFANADLGTNDAISFFKRAISDPPDIEHFIGKFRSLQNWEAQAGLSEGAHLVPISYFEGGRAGSSFYMRSIPDPNSPTKTPAPQIIFGREKDKVYEIGGNAITFRKGTNQVKPIMFNLICQFLDMGITELDTKTVIWKGNTFSAVRTDGLKVRGELEVTNNLPYKMTIAYADGFAHKLEYRYKYSDDSKELDGFPSRITVNTISDSESRPTAQLDLISVRISSGPIRKGFFSETNFLNANIRFTNIYSNGIIYLTRHDGKVISSPLSNMGAAPQNVSKHKRKALYVVIFLLALCPFAYLAYKIRYINQPKKD